MNVYIHNTYKDFFRTFIADQNTRGIISQIAAACGCDRTYLSQVLNGKADLTPDHLIQFCESWGIGESDSDYLLLLLLRDRSSSLKARKFLDARVKQAKTEALTLSNKVVGKEKPKEIREELRALYYSSWIYGAVHILTSIPEFQTTSAIAQKLSVQPLTINQTLKDLVEMGVVKSEKGRYTHVGGDIYLPRQSAQISAHHLGWRMKSVERACEKGDVHYTLTFSVSSDDVEKLRLQIIDLIEAQRRIVRASGCETACVFCVDFFAL